MEFNKAVEELEILWEKGNKESLHFCRYMRAEIENLANEYIYENETVYDPEFEERFEWLDDDVFTHWRHAKFEAGECNMLGYPKGE